jgi:cellobiose-specific phosphotransferase system component IIA
MRCTSLAGHEETVSAYNRMRDQEYEQIISRAREVVADAQRHLAHPHVTLSDLVSSDRGLKSIKNSLRQIQAQDVLGAENAKRAIGAVAGCENAVDALAARVFRSDESRASQQARKALP